MSFPFSSYETEPLDFIKYLPSHSGTTTITASKESINSVEMPKSFPLAFLQEANRRRDRMATLLLTQPDTPPLSDAIEAYIPILMRLYTDMENYRLSKRSPMAFIRIAWKSNLSRGIRSSKNIEIFEKPWVVMNCPGLVYEVTMTMIALATCLSNMASIKLGMNVSSGIFPSFQIPGTSSSSNSPIGTFGDGSVFNEAVELLCRAGGIFQSTLRTFSVDPASWTSESSLGDSLKNIFNSGPSAKVAVSIRPPPECLAGTLQLLSQLMIADAHKLILQKAEIKGTMSRGTLLRLAITVLQFYEQCSDFLIQLEGDSSYRKNSKLPPSDIDIIRDHLSAPLRSYIMDGRICLEGLIGMKFAIIKQEEGEGGLSAGSIIQSNIKFTSCSSSDSGRKLRLALSTPPIIQYRDHQRFADSMIPEVQSLKDKYIQLNNNITYHKVPQEWSEIRSSFPIPATPIASLKTYIIPQPIEFE